MRAGIFARIEHAIVHGLTSRPAASFLVGVAVCVVGLAGLPRIIVDNDYRTFLGEDDPALAVSDWLSDRNGQARESLVLIYQPKSGDAFETANLLQYAFVAREASALPYVTDVESLLDVTKLVVGTVDGKTGEVFREAPFTFGADIFSAEGQSILRTDALTLPTVRSRFIGNAGASAAVIIFVDISDTATRQAQITELTGAIDDLASRLRTEAAGDRLFVAGTALFEFSAFQVLRSDLRGVIPLAAIFVIAVIFAVYRSVFFVAAATSILLACVFVSAGVAGWMGLVFSNLSTSALLLVGTLAVADLMHVSNSYFGSMADGRPKLQALETAIRRNMKVVIATTVTTSVGQIALLFSAAPPIRTMGLIVLIGCWLTLLLTLLMLPAILLRSRPGGSTQLKRAARALARCAVLGFRYARGIAVVSSVALIFCLTQVIGASVSDSLTGWFSEETDFRRAMDLLDRQYLGGDTLTIAIEATSDDLVATRRYPSESASTDTYRALQEDLITAAEGAWFSPAATALATRKLLDSGRETSLRGQPETFDLLKPFSTETVVASGLLTPFQPGKVDYSLWYFDGSADSSFAVVRASQSIQAVIDGHVGDRSVRVGGIGLALAGLSVENFFDVLSGSLLSILLICVFMVVLMRHNRVWLAAVFANLAPLIVAFGGWAAVYGYFNLAVVTVFSVCLGIIVDDTLHILLKYAHLRQRSASAEQAYCDAIEECGVGVLTTTLVVSAGLFLLGTSDFLLTSQKALLGGVAVVIAFLFDLFVLPAIVALTARGAEVRAALPVPASNDVD